MAKHSSTNPNIPSWIPGPVSYRGGMVEVDEACTMHLAPGAIHNCSKAVGIKNICPLCTK